MSQATSDVADQGSGEVNQPNGGARLVHGLANEEEEGHGQ